MNPLILFPVSLHFIKLFPSLFWFVLFHNGISSAEDILLLKVLLSLLMFKRVFGFTFHPLKQIKINFRIKRQKFVNSFDNKLSGKSEIRSKTKIVLSLNSNKFFEHRIMCQVLWNVFYCSMYEN